MSITFIVPILALGAAFLISSDKNDVRKNRRKNPLKEGFNDQHMETNNVATGDYLNQNAFEDQNGKGGTIREIYSLTGKYIDPNDFKHKNMVPFYGGKLKGQQYGMNTSESILDNMVGSGSQITHKVEQAPLFNPEDNVQWSNGMPSTSEFIKSRMNTSLISNNTTPFKPEMVGPGLNQGYSNSGSGGFNSSLEARELYMPKSVDELRVSTNPKLETNIEQYQGPSASRVHNLGTIGRVEKNRPDTFYIQSQDRWLTTTGQEKGPTLRSQIEMFDTARNQQTGEYIGVAGRADSVGFYASRNYKDPTKQASETIGITPSCAVNRGPENQNKLASFKNYANNRSTTNDPETFGSGFTTAIGAVVAPLMDILNPTRRQEMSKNVRIYGDAGTTVPENYLMNPSDKPNVTIRETTLFTPPLGIPSSSNNSIGGYIVNEQVPIANQRTTSKETSYYGDAGGGVTRWGTQCYASAYSQHNNDLKEPTLVSRINHGNMSIYNEPEINFSMKNDCDIINNRTVVPTNLPSKFVTKDMLTETRRPMCYESPDRNQPDLLNAFRQNPYTQSLSSVA